MPAATATEVQPREERPQRGRVEARRSFASGRRRPRGSLQPSRPRSSEAPSAGHSSDERAEQAGARVGGLQQQAAAHARAPRRQPGRAARAQQRLARGGGVVPALRVHGAAALAVAAEVEGERRQSGRRRLLAHELAWFSLRLPAPWQTSSAPRGGAGRQEEQAGQPQAVADDRDAPGVAAGGWRVGRRVHDASLVRNAASPM